MRSKDTKIKTAFVFMITYLILRSLYKFMPIEYKYGLDEEPGKQCGWCEEGRLLVIRAGDFVDELSNCNRKTRIT